MPPPARRVRAAASASSSALRMPIIHSPSPSAPTQPTGPAQWPRAPVSCRAMKASASARGVPPTAGVGWRRCRSSSTPTGRASRPSILVPRWATERKATTEGTAGTDRSAQNGPRAAAISSTTKRCSSRFLAERARSRWASASLRAVSPRGTVPARGWHDTRVPCRATRSSGLAPKKEPSAMGMEKMVQFGSPARSRRRTAARGSGPRSWTSTGRDSTTLRSVAPGRSMTATASATMAA